MGVGPIPVPGDGGGGGGGGGATLIASIDYATTRTVDPPDWWTGSFEDVEESFPWVDPESADVPYFVHESATATASHLVLPAGTYAVSMACEFYGAATGLGLELTVRRTSDSVAIASIEVSGRQATFMFDSDSEVRLSMGVDDPGGVTNLYPNFVIVKF